MIFYSLSHCFPLNKNLIKFIPIKALQRSTLTFNLSGSMNMNTDHSRRYRNRQARVANGATAVLYLVIFLLSFSVFKSPNFGQRLFPDRLV